jgi:4-hydroxythreonine-4-phosphate dehydrogenase
MILVTQGHEKSIALEIFFKSYSCLPHDKKKLITLYTVRKSLEDNLEKLSIPYTINDDQLTFFGQSLRCHFVTVKTTDTSDCMLAALKNIRKGDLLFTLPSTKAEFILEGKIVNGHTEFLRQFYKLPDLSMFFFSDRLKILLTTDHLPLSQVASSINSRLICSKVAKTLEHFSFREVRISGINPHSGEGGLLGTEDHLIGSAVNELKALYPNIVFTGPIAGDSLHHFQSPTTLLVYMFHDQGLSMFKSQAQGFSINCTLGLPFHRLSVDHGTALDLFGKNEVNYQSCLYGLIKAAEFHENKIQFH